MRVFVLNGPNLDLLGRREPEMYGRATLADVEKLCRERAIELGMEIEFRQTNDEAEMIGWLHEAIERADAIVINPAAWTHYSLALREALAAANVPVVEVHITNIYAREEWRAKSVVSGVARAVISGLGIRGYAAALDGVSDMLNAD
ncbi:MAG: type II 3-dehydroquinate dehydratase [Actinomycetota bacterium]